MSLVFRNVRNRKWTTLTLSALLEHGSPAELQPVLARIERYPYGKLATQMERALAAPGREYPLNDSLVRNHLAVCRAAKPRPTRKRKTS